MKTKKSIVLLMVAIVAILNIFYVSYKNKTVLKELHLMEILAFADDENEFPDDPWGDEDSGNVKYQIRRVDKYHAYSYSLLGEDLYNEYRVPVTEVVCINEGEVSCIPSLSLGFWEHTGTVKESEMKDPKL